MDRIGTLLLWAMWISLGYGQSVTTYTYANIPGADSNALSLDVYQPGGTGPAPIIFYVHGGSWRLGDKANVGAKADWFTANGYLFISANYRLSPNPPQPEDPSRLTFPSHPRDVANALAFTIENARQWGGDTSRIGLIGHSAGAHLVALIATDPRYMEWAGSTIDPIDAVAVLDAGALDIPYWLDNYAGGGLLLTYVNAFTDDRSVWEEASPQMHFSKGDPPQLLVHQGIGSRIDINQRYEQVGTRVGVPIERYNAYPFTHSEINQVVGRSEPEAVVLNTTILDFFERHLSSTVTDVPTRTDWVDVYLYPNPTSGAVRFELPETGGYRIRLINGMGQRLDEFVANGPITYDLSDFPLGRYYFQLNPSNGESIYLSVLVAR